MSSNPLLWKLVLIGVVVAGAVVAGYPPAEKINLGLDLRGGAHILMEVDTAAAVTYQVELTQSRIGQQLKEEGIGYEAIVTLGEASLELRGTDASKVAEAREVLDAVVGGWEVVDAGSGTWRATMPPDLRTYYATTAVDMTLATMRNRIDALGVGEQLVQKQGLKGDRILIQLPGVEDPERVKDILQDPARLEWKAVSYPPGVGDPGAWGPPADPQQLLDQFGGALPPDTELYPQEVTNQAGEKITVQWPLKRVSVVVGGDLRNAYRSSSQWDEPAVSFELTADAGRRFAAATRENMGRHMAIVLGSSDQKSVVSAPIIQGVIHEQGIIQGRFTVEEAEDLALKLRSGSIPTEVKIIEERVVGPSLGRDSIRSGLFAGVAGFLVVLVFMVAYYRLSGVNAVVALLLNVVLVFGALGALPYLFSTVSNLRVTLTLPGIAGLILTVGMAVDSNVLVFERIREELRLGKTVRTAVAQGFSKAFMTILDCHVTTISAAIFLGVYGTGPVRGFAVTLIIGLAVSMFTAVFVSRQLFELVLARKQRVETLSI
jgi:preprotein translocase subunit SecD